MPQASLFVVLKVFVCNHKLIINKCLLLQISCSHVPPGTLVMFSFPGDFFLCRTIQCLRPILKLKMNWNCVGWSFIDVLWAFLALCFLVALCFHRMLPHQLGKHVSCRLIVIFQDLIRYGKTKNLKRDTWLVVFDVPKRYTRFGNATS